MIASCNHCFQYLPRRHFIKVEGFNDEEKIVEELQKKFDSIINRNLYTKYKTAPTEEEKEKARQEYLDRKGIHSNFRW